MKPLERCANGCDEPPKPPSLVICGPCQDKITAKLESMVAEQKLTEHEWRAVFRARCGAKQGRSLTDDEHALINRAFATDEKRYSAMSAEVFNATVPFGSNVRMDARGRHPTDRKRGFAALDPERVRALGRLGGKAAQEGGLGHRFTTETARAAAKKSVHAPGTHRFTSETAREAGRKGGAARVRNLARAKEQGDQ